VQPWLGRQLLEVYLVIQEAGSSLAHAKSRVCYGLPKMSSEGIILTCLGVTNFGDGLRRILLRIPLLSGVLNRLVLEILAKLNLEEILRVILGIKLYLIPKNVIWMRVGLGNFLVQLLLGIG
jgi:hypothetical protein